MKIQANGISMNYELTGSGRYFTLIHGAGDNLNEWFNQVPVFSQRYQVLTYDVRGHGQTEVPDVDITTEIWIEDLYGLLKALNISETILLGFSMGGMIALGFTAAHPEMVTALILSNSGGGAPRERPSMSEEEMRQMEARRQAQFESIRKNGMASVVDDRISRMFTPDFIEKKPDTVDKYRSILMQNNPEGYLKVMQRMGRGGSPPDLSKITCPTLIIAGERDGLGGTAGQSTQEAIPGSQLKTFPTGHYTLFEMTREYNEAIMEYLTGVGL